MGCCGGDREKGPTKESQKWAYITLTDFRATSAWNTVAYVWLWILFMSTVVIYAVDTFTAINLLVFNKWASQVKPVIPFDVSKWIFAGCIIFSWVLWGFEWVRAIRVIRRGGVAESYMDPLAAELQSMRSQGWRRFLVFAALTKSKKGADLIAFFVYFAFKGAIRILVAEGPRQVINTLTLIAVVKADFVENTSSGETGFKLFWANLETMWNTQKLQAIIIFSMMYSLVIWVISSIALAIAAVLYIMFLWHYIPTQDGGLAGYCRRKIATRLEKIVESKVKAAIEDEERKRRKAEEKQLKANMRAEKKGKLTDTDDMPATLGRQPTLPQLDDDDDNFQPLQRTNTAGSVATLPLYDSRPGTRNDDRPPLPGYPGSRPPQPMRSATMNSQYSQSNYEPNAPLLSNAAQVGESPMIARPGTAFSRKDSNAGYGAQPMPRMMTPAQRSYTPANGPPRMPGQQPYPPGPGRPYPPRTMTNNSQQAFSPMLRTDFSQNSSNPNSDSPWNRGPARSESPFGEPRGLPERKNTSPPLSRQATNSPINQSNPSLTRQQTFNSISSTNSFSRPLPLQINKSQQNFNKPFTPAPANDAMSSSDNNSFEMKSNPYISKAGNSENKSAGGYLAFNPARTASPAPMHPSASNRTNTVTSEYFEPEVKSALAARANAAPLPDNRQTFGYSDLVTSYGKNSTPSPAPPPVDKSWTNNRF